MREHLFEKIRVWRGDHFLKKLFDGAAFVGQHAGKVIERSRTLLAVPDHDAAVQDGPAQHGESRFRPVILQALAVGIDQHGGHVLHVRNRQQRIQADFFQGIEGGGCPRGV